jgi:ABC-2 type transport system permease protein
MNEKLRIIIRREFLNIVTKKTFLIATFLLPLGFAAFIALEVAALSSVEKEDLKVLIPREKVSIFDKPEYQFQNTTNLEFEIVNNTPEELNQRVGEAEGEIWLLPPSENLIAGKKVGSVTLYGPTTISDPTKREIRRQMDKRIRSYRLNQEGLSEEKLESLEFDLSLNTQKIKDGEAETGIEFLTKVVGGVMGFAIYMLLAIYGSILMQSVIEEKTNRIVEIIVSSVKPFDLLLGKTIAMVGVALTQLVIWGALITVIYLVAMPFMLGNIDPSALQQPNVDLPEAQEMVLQLQQEIAAFNWSIVWVMPLFFIGGFFLYGSLYAAVGAAVDNVQDSQQLAFPLTIPLILSVFVGMNIIQNPNSTLAMVCSQIPFFSPMIMPVRMAATDVAWWEVVLSLLLLAGGFLACMWVAGKIYRIGILMYGKKASFKELWRWLRA